MPNRTTVLNVDGHPLVRQLRTRALRAAGFTVIEGETGQEALDLVRTAHPHIVLLDVNLPDMDGFDLCHHIKDDPDTQSTMVVFLTATSDGLEDKLTGATGGDSYLTKPVEPREVVSHLLALLRLKRTEEALRDANVTLEALVSASPLAVVTLDCAGLVQRWNPAAERLFGWTAAEALGQRNPIAPPELQHEFENHLQATLHGRPQTGIETIRMCKDGRRIPVSLSVAPLRDKSGQVVGALALIEDISARRQAEAELARLYEESQQAARAKDEFLAMLSHELRTPFNAMLLWIQMLRRGTVSPDRVDYALEVIERNAMAQLRLIEDILDVSSIISGKLRLQLETLDLVRLARSAAAGLAPSIDARRQEFVVNLPDGEVLVDGDAARLQQVFNNLLSNAVKFTPIGGRVELIVARSGERASITVADNGNGIEPAFLPHVFEQFRQADNARSRAHGGLGLGLAIVRHLTDAHHGHVHAESAGIGCGATFTVTLPVATAQITTVAPLVRQNASTGSLAGTTLLIVDDHDDARDVLRQLLVLHGATVLSATSAEEAVRLVLSEQPSVLVADIGMPGEDGLSMIARLRGRLGAQPLYAIAVSGYASADDRIMAERAGFDEHLPKPIDADLVLAAVTRGTSAMRARQAELAREMTPSREADLPPALGAAAT